MSDTTGPGLDEPEELFQSLTFWLGAIFSLVVFGFIVLFIATLRFCCCHSSVKREIEIDDENKIEITLEEGPTEIAINGEHYSVEKEENRVFLKPKPKVEELSKAGRIAKSITETRHKYFSRQGPRFSAFYSGNTSHEDEYSSLNRQLFAKSKEGAPETEATETDGVPLTSPRDSGSTALSQYLKQGMKLMDKQRKKGYVSGKKMIERMSSSKKTKTIEEVKGKPEVKKHKSNLLRKSPDSAEVQNQFQEFERKETDDDERVPESSSNLLRKIKKKEDNSKKMALPEVNLKKPDEEV